MTPAGSTSTALKVGSAAGLVVGGLAYALSLFNYALDPLRTASAPGYWSNVYDLQARALIDGHLSLPTGSLGIEGIVHDGKTHMYFPLFPALLRLPVLLTTHEFDGKLTLLSMGLAWVLFAVMLTRLFWLVLRVVTGEDHPTGVQAAFGAVFLAAATGGTTLTYDASLPWVYHEAYVWAAAAAVGTMYWMVRVLVDGQRSSVQWLGTFVLLAVLTRPTEGWALGVVTIAVGLWVATGRARAVDRRLWWAILLCGVVPLGVGVAISEIKFDSFFMHPLSEQVWTSVNAHRREALAANGGSLTGPQFFLSSVVAYFGLGGIRFVGYFPWITLPAEPAHAYSGAVVDQTYRTGSVTTFMPLLLALSVLAFVVLARPRARSTDRALLPPLVAGVLVTGGVMAYGYFSFRYVTDFVPALVYGACVGFALLCRWLHGRRVAAIGVLVATALVSAFSIVAHLAVGYATASVAAAGPELRRYVDQQVALSGPELAAQVQRSATLPVRGPTDSLVVTGDCAGLYLGTGDLYRPWATVATRDLVLDVRRAGTARAGTVRLMTTTDGATGALQTDGTGRGRVVLTSPQGDVVRGTWQSLDSALHVRVANKTELEFFLVSTEPGGDVGGLPATRHDPDALFSPVMVSPVTDTAAATASGVAVTSSWGAAPQVCREVTSLARASAQR